MPGSRARYADAHARRGAGAPLAGHRAAISGFRTPRSAALSLPSRADHDPPRSNASCAIHPPPRSNVFSARGRRKATSSLRSSTRAMCGRQTRQSRPYRRHAQTHHPHEPHPQKSKLCASKLNAVAPPGERNNWSLPLVFRIVVGQILSRDTPNAVL